MLNSVQYRTQIVPLVGSPKTVILWSVPRSWSNRFAPPCVSPTYSQCCKSALVWSPVNVTVVLVSVEPGVGERIAGTVVVVTFMA